MREPTYAWDLESGTLLWSAAAPGGIDVVALSPDARTAYSGSAKAGAKLAVWDLTRGSRTEVEAHPYGIHAIAVSPDGREVATGGGERDGRIALWNAHTWTLEKRLGDGPGTIYALAFAPDGKSLVSAAGNAPTIWDIDRGAAVRTFTGHTDFVVAVAFAPDGRMLLSSGFDGTAILWDAQTGARKKSLAGPRNWIRTAVFSPDGQRALTGDDRGSLRLWDLGSGAVVRTIEAFRHEVTRIKVTPDGAHAVVVTREGGLEVWNLASGKLERANRDLGEPTTSLDVSRDGRIAVTAGKDGGITVWDLPKGRRLRRIPAGARIKSVALSPDGRRVLSYAFGQGALFRLWDVDTGAPVRTFTAFPAQMDPGAAAFTPDGRTVIVAMDGSDDLQTFDAATGAAGRKLPNAGGQVAALAVSPDGRYALGGLAAQVNATGRAVLWDLQTGSHVDDRGEGASILAVAFSPDGLRAVVGGADKKVRLLEVPSMREIAVLSGHTRATLAVDATSDGHFISGGADGTLRVWKGAGPASMVLAAGGNDWVLYDEGGRFDGSRHAGTLVAAVQGTRGFQIDQLAPRNNRPDTVLSGVGEGSMEALAHYKARHDRRLVQLGLTEDALAATFDRAPTARIASVAQHDKWLDVVADVASPTGEPLTFNIHVNDVPLFGALGKPLAPGTRRVAERIELSRGRSRVEVSVRGASGAESLRDFRIATCDSASHGDLYFVGLGVTHYKNPAYDLAYPHKDALDLADTLKQARGPFRQVHATALVNEQVTVAGVRAAKDLLRGATVDDTVVVFVAGHGLHARDAAAQYYFATHELDLAHLAQTAAPYELVEDLLQGIAPRRKLLLLDTCESGEPDDASDIAPRGNLVARGFRGLTLELPRTRRFLFDRDRFIESDLARRTGAIVLSSSSGSERSWESADIQNGVFTEEILRSLTTSVADTNGDGLLSTDELRAYVIAAVPRVTQDAQHPSVDRDNLDMTFELPIVPAALPILTRSDPLGPPRRP